MIVCKILEVEDKQLSDFNYRLLNNILCNNAYLCKWKVDVKPECRMCNKMETSYHLIYECKNVLLIWRLLSEFLSFDVKWKHIIIGFYLENNRKTATLNFLISLIALRIYKYKMYCRLEKIDENEEGLKTHIKLSLLNYASVLRLKYKSRASYITDFARML